MLELAHALQASALQPVGPLCSHPVQLVHCAAYSNIFIGESTAAMVKWATLQTAPDLGLVEGACLTNVALDVDLGLVKGACPTDVALGLGLVKAACLQMLPLMLTLALWRVHVLQVLPLTLALIVEGVDLSSSCDVLFT